MATQASLQSFRTRAACAGAALALNTLLCAPAAHAQAESPAGGAETEATDAESGGADSGDADSAEAASATEKQTRIPVPTEQDGTTTAAVMGAKGPPKVDRLEWAGGFLYGGLELDIGYAGYKYPELQSTPRETVHDLRGRFVVGHMLDHPFGDSGYYLRATGQLVAWAREKERLYQINVDDVYGEFGSRGKWDIQVGRFMTWRVYHKGLGFDLYTLEDNGASATPPISNASFVVHSYEVDYIYLRNSPYVGGEVAGRGAVHLYPTDFLGVELATAYGLAQNEAANTIGGRLAVDLNLDFLRITAAGEYRKQTRTAPLFEPGMMGQGYVECSNCSDSDNKGVGGGAIVKLAPVELGGGFAKGWDRAFKLSGGGTGKAEAEPAGSGSRMSFGGYAQFDIGTLVFQRALIVGAGMHRTEWILDNNNQQYHDQLAAYIALPLGLVHTPRARFESTGSVHDAMLKLVVSRSDAELFDATDVEGRGFIRRERSMMAGRVRLAYPF